MNRAENKAQRLLQIEKLLWAHPEGLSQSDVARKTGVNRSTIWKYIQNNQLPPGVYVDEFDEDKLKLDRSADLTKASFNLHEIMALHLATRLLATRMDKQSPFAASALRKLAKALQRVDHNVSQHLLRSADVMDEATAYRDPVYLQVLETLTQAWSAGRKVKVTHLNKFERIDEYIYSPYFIEPYAVGQTTHVLGWCEPLHAMRTFKIERLRSAVMLPDRYEIPADFDPAARLRNAWGIWCTDSEPVEVVLRFHPNVARRVQETQWQRGQQIEMLPDGWLLWRALIAEPQEMLPWIRGWGADVEVVGPEKLRNEVKSHVISMATTYEVTNIATDTEPFRLLWAKADRKTGAIHRLVYHMLDVGLVAQLIWDKVLHPALKQKLATWLNLTVEETGRLVAFLASLHDLGKASPAFQDHPRMPGQLKARVMAELRQAGFGFQDNRPQMERRSRHEVISTWSLRSGSGEQLLNTVTGLPGDLSDLFSQALGGHHGVWPHPGLFIPTLLTVADKGGDEWTLARSSLVAAMKRVFRPPAVSGFTSEQSKDNIRLTLLSAIVAVSDWIGSQEEHFPAEDQVLPLEAYVRHARSHAHCALADVQWETPAEMPELDFTQVFRFESNPFQSQILESLEQTPLPALAIIEGPMGVGKTEAAFAVYADWAKRSGTAGVYIAMPTTATSNQMYDRTKKFLSTQLGRQIEPMLVHSQALLRDLPVQNDPVEEQEHEGDATSGESWFLPRRKSLLAPYGVGTVDQALMSILQTKHFFVRLLGLSHKVVVFDEVHAYDAYMSELFERLLAWLRAVDASVIILSATLPDKTRQKLVQAYSGKTNVIADGITYPRLTFVHGGGVTKTVALPAPPTKTLHYAWLPRDEGAIIEKLSESLVKGGCAVVICNTVTRAQTIFQAIRDQPEKLCDDDDLILFHARFPMAWREEIEQKVIQKFGVGADKSKPNPNRPQRAIVVATQVIEQSLDLDFDIMISDHAPIDLLLQRSGRLHRHAVNDVQRQHPNCLWIAEPPVEHDAPLFDRSDKYVYDEYVLMRSWLALKSIADCKVDVPDSVADLIEAVYGDKQPPSTDAQQAALSVALAAMNSDQFGERAKARKRRIPRPDDEDLLWGENLALEEDDPTVHETFQAMTRSDRPGLSVVCLHRVQEQLLFDPTDPASVYNPLAPESPHTIRELARHSVTIRRSDVEKHLLAEPADEQVRTILTRWRRISALRYHRLIIFEGGKCTLNDTPYVLRLDKFNQLGLQISKEAQ